MTSKAVLFEPGITGWHCGIKKADQVHPDLCKATAVQGNEPEDPSHVSATGPGSHQQNSLGPRDGGPLSRCAHHIQVSVLPAGLQVGHQRGDVDYHIVVDLEVEVRPELRMTLERRRVFLARIS